MEKGNFIIEIGCEDLPVWSGKYLEEKWFPVFKNELIENRLNFEDIKFFYTSRRIILYGKNVNARQIDIKTEISGPPASAGIDEKGNFTRPALKFAEAHNVSYQDLKIEEKKGKKVIVLTKFEKGVSALKILGKIAEESLEKIEIPRGMKWTKKDFKFLRPVRWILSLLENRVIPMKLGDVKSDNKSFGHRVLSPGKISIADPVEYFDKITKNFVMFDQKIRGEFLCRMIKEKLQDFTYVKENEVMGISGYVEYPIVSIGKISEKYLSLPDEVIQVVIKKLKSIPVYLKENNSLSPDFVLVFDGVEGGKIRENYEKVLGDKLEDAHFFIYQDMKFPLSSYTEKLKKIVYNPKWGTVYDRLKRFHKVASSLQELMNLDDNVSKNLFESISLCKNDLATLMVGEFPELQGIIGRIYAEKNDYNNVVSSAIEQHYWPKFAGDKVPDTLEGNLLSLIDRMETLCSFLLEGVKLTGSGDPFGLKRMAVGIIEIIWKSELDVPLTEVIKETLKSLKPGYPAQVENDIFLFILQRADNLFTGEGISSGMRKSVMSVEKENILTIRKKINALKTFLLEEESGNIFVPFIRVANILKQAEEMSVEFNDFSHQLLKDETEKKLYSFYTEKENILKELYRQKDYLSFLENLREWKAPVDKFFDDVLVMCPEENIRNNRLSLLKKINDIFLLFADFSYILPEETENVTKK